jgi:hypothetical protein
MDDRITVSVLSRAADVIADTNRGLSGKKLISYCNQFAVDYDIRIPHATYPFQAGSKRTALFENLQAFPSHIQYSLLMELCSDWQYLKNEEVKAMQSLLRERYSHLASVEFIQPSAPVSTPQPVTATSIITSTAPTPKAAPLPSSRPQVPSKAYDIFLSYSHVDEELVTFVRDHLVLYDRQGRIRKWWDRKILPGTPIGTEIRTYLSSSEIILLFVSASFLASDYCYDIEMQQALGQHAEGRSVVIPIILRHCVWRDTSLGELEALPADGRPLVTWPDRDEAGKNIAEGVMRIIANLQSRQRSDPPQR